ncbi:hypothetical protein ACFW7O_17210 [Streptomyces diastatochromogenes]|uniref:hypothetical protein n=1 Tax=Streptomyces diastatochromogenes TaxID=42236 RepID=UPI00367AB363
MTQDGVNRESGRTSPPSGCGPRPPEGADSRSAALTVVFELVEYARQLWRSVQAPHLVAHVRAGARLAHGRFVERPGAVAA